jgi:inhibitor of KinA
MRFSPLGDRAILIHVGSTIDEATHRRVRAVFTRLTEHPIGGIVEIVPAYVSVAVHYDPAAFVEAPSVDGSGPYVRLCVLLGEALSPLDVARLPTAQLVEIAVCYGGEFGPDLEDVARHRGLSADDVVRIHSTGDYLVYMIGFAPGFPYLGGLDARIAAPRRTVPRTLVPAGSVGIGGDQTGVYPIASPGGWQLIGRTPQRLFVAQREPPTLIHAGDRVRFRPISANEFAAQAASIDSPPVEAWTPSQ